MAMARDSRLGHPPEGHAFSGVQLPHCARRLHALHIDLAAIYLSSSVRKTLRQWELCHGLTIWECRGPLVEMSAP